MQNAQLFLEFAKKYWPWILSFVALCLLVWAFLAGYRLGLDGVTRAGAVVIQELPIGTDVYIDDVRRHVGAHTETRTVLSPGTHSIIVDAPGFQPWNELVEVTHNEDTQVTPILIPERINSRALPETEAAIAKRDALPLPTFEAPLVVPDACVQIFTSYNRVIAAPGTDCEPPPYLCSTDGTCEPTVVFSPTEELRSVIMLPSRSDALVVSAGKNVYTIEIDPRTPQFFAPLYVGTTPTLGVWGIKSFVVFDSKGVMEILI